MWDGEKHFEIVLLIKETTCGRLTQFGSISHVTRELVN